MMPEKKIFYIFDLDDTLYSEIDFLISGYKHIIKGLPILNNPKEIFDEMLNRYQQEQDVFDWLVKKLSEENLHTIKNNFIQQYRYHVPDIHLREDAAMFLRQIQNKHMPAGLITDGRSITQRNKLNALGLTTFFADIIISEEFGSEKPNPNNYLFFAQKYPGYNFCFIGDNTSKDFIVPKQLGWKFYCIKDSGFNIHPQNFSGFNAYEIVSSFYEIPLS
ncbi:MAG: HAD family hydrolase [Chitinophagaceae bacterium]|nr:HAD family hydrolase [Chitinophagaceae bacterium]